MNTINLTTATREANTGKAISLRWTYIILPLAILLIAIILTAYFYHLLPGEVAYHFEGGSADKWMSRGGIIAWLLIPQFIFTLLALAITWGATRLSARLQSAEDAAVKLILPLMGNMVALPQIILGFAMLDIFSYNAYQIRLIPLWVFAVLVMGAGGIVLILFFLQAIRRIQATAKVSRSNSNGGSVK